MKLIELTQDKCAQIDDEDYENLNQYKWHAHKDGLTFYARRQMRLKKMVNKKQFECIMKLWDLKAQITLIMMA